MSATGSRPLIDAHAHVQARQFDGDREAVLARARAAGVGAIVCSSDDLDSSRNAIALAERNADVWATVGIHPHEASGCDEHALLELEQLAASPRVVAIGEIGIDYYRDLSPRPVQRDAFTRQLELAERTGRPVVIHSRDAAEDTYTILRAWSGLRANRLHQMHCFGYDVTWAERFLELGFMLSIPGTVTYPKAEQVKAVAAMAPDDRLTVETDCPYLTPQSRRGKRNEPGYLAETVSMIASLRGTDPDAIGELSAANARRLFRLDAGQGEE